MNECSNEQIRVRTVLMRGGSSKAVFLNESDVPRDHEERTRFLLALFGSPDKRQIDGLGGSDILTSKCAIIGPPSRPDADVDYTFAQVSVDKPIVNYDIACGNITAAAGSYAVEEGYVEATAPFTTVRVHNTNTGRVMRITVPVRNGMPQVEGDCAIDGVPGTGAEIKLDFSGTAGAVTGKILPTGNVRDVIEVQTLGRRVDVSVVDVANPCAFVAAADLGLTGGELPGHVPELTLDAIVEIRSASAHLSGIDSHLLPFVVTIGEACSYHDYLTGRMLPAEQCDLVARLFSERNMHKAYAGTGATCLAVATRIIGTVPHAIVRPGPATAPLRIGHPSGVLTITADVAAVDGAWKVNEVVFSRTARRLMEGWAYVRKARLEGPAYRKSQKEFGGDARPAPSAGSQDEVPA